MLKAPSIVLEWYQNELLKLLIEAYTEPFVVLG